MGKPRGLTVGVAIVLIAIGCGGGGSAQRVTVEPTALAMRQAADATLSKGTTHVAITMALDINEQPLTLNATGGVDPANKRVSLSFDVKDFFGKLLGGQKLPDAATAALSQPLTVLIDGTTMYMRVPFIAAIQGSTKEWVKVDLAASNAGLGDLLGSGGSVFGSDPSSFLQFLKGAGKVTEVGREDVRGTSTRHFNGSFTIKDALGTLPEDQRQKIENSFKGFGLPDSAEATEIPFDVWIGDDGVVRKMSYTLDVTKLDAAAANAKTGNITATMEFFDFGQPIDFQLPTDDEVQDFASVFGPPSSEQFSSAGSTIN